MQLTWGFPWRSCSSTRSRHFGGMTLSMGTPSSGVRRGGHPCGSVSTSRSRRSPAGASRYSSGTTGSTAPQAASDGNRFCHCIYPPIVTLAQNPKVHSGHRYVVKRENSGTIPLLFNWCVWPAEPNRRCRWKRRMRSAHLRVPPNPRKDGCRLSLGLEQGALGLSSTCLQRASDFNKSVSASTSRWKGGPSRRTLIG